MMSYPKCWKRCSALITCGSGLARSIARRESDTVRGGHVVLERKWLRCEDHVDINGDDVDIGGDDVDIDDVNQSTCQARQQLAVQLPRWLSSALALQQPIRQQPFAAMAGVALSDYSQW